MAITPTYNLASSGKQSPAAIALANKGPVLKPSVA